MKNSKPLAWMIGLGLLSFTLVGMGTASSPHDAQAAAESAPLCPPFAASTSERALAVELRTGGSAGAGPPLNGAADTRAFAIAAASPKSPTSTSLVFLPLWARQ